MDETARLTDEFTSHSERQRHGGELIVVRGLFTAEWRDADGHLKHMSEQTNLVTAVGDRLYASRGAGLTTSALPVGMKLGTGATAASKTGAGAALVAYLANSQQGFDATFPSEGGGVATYKVTYAAGKATSAGANITEAVIFTDSISDATSVAANTIARVLLASPAPKAAGDTLTCTWTHTILGA